MNKNDLILIIIILIIASLLLLNFENEEGTKAMVYYKNDLILTVNLNKDNTYEVDGDNGKVVIKVENNKIKVVEETSNYHLCSKQGYINKPGQSIICLPNKIIIEIPNDFIDTEVK